MKKIFVAAIILLSVSAAAQKNNWSVSFLVAPGFGGPQKSIVEAMEKQGFAQTFDYNFLGMQGSIDYPQTERSGCYLVNVSLKKRGNGRLYFVAGISNGGTVSGYHPAVSDSAAGIFYSSTFPRVNYKIIQFSGGYEISPKNSAIRFGIAPSIFLFNHRLDEPAAPGTNETSVVPGGSFQVRLPLGKEKKTFGLDLIAEANLAPKAKMKELRESSIYKPLQETKVNMIHGTAGILLTFRG